MSTFGTLFKVTTFGESHCKAVGCIVDGIPARMRVMENDIQPMLDRRRPAIANSNNTPRTEEDKIHIMSGTERGYTLGSPVCLMIYNKEHRFMDHVDPDFIPRPSHADYTYAAKYGILAQSGGGRASARETAARVAAGAIADKWLNERYGTEIVAYVSKVGRVTVCDDDDALLARDFIHKNKQKGVWLTRDLVDSHIVRCPISETADKMVQAITQAKAKGDSIGGTITCVIRNCPVGIGEPCFDRLGAVLSHAMMSIPATKGFTIGLGFDCIEMNGSTHNDPFSLHPCYKTSLCSCQPDTALNTNVSQMSNLSKLASRYKLTSEKQPSFPVSMCEKCRRGRICPREDFPPLLSTTTNFSRGQQGGISNGNVLTFTVAFKPVSTISQPQNTITIQGRETVLENRGRHDPCVVPRAVVVVEAMAALVLADLALIQEAKASSSSQYPFLGIE